MHQLYVQLITGRQDHIFELTLDCHHTMNMPPKLLEHAT